MCGSSFIAINGRSLPLSTLSQFVGYSDEVLDVKFVGKDDSHIVVATNSCQLKVFELLTNSCQILYGHTGQSPAEGSMSMNRATCEGFHSITVSFLRGKLKDVLSTFYS